MAVSKATLKTVRKVKKPKAPPLKANSRRWEKYRDDLKEYEEFQKQLDIRRRLRDS